MIKLFKLCGVVFVILFLSHCQSPGEKIQNPNIVLILADDMGYGDVKCYYPNAKVETPNMDGLAREGMRFSDAHTPSSVCTPTRYGILTGRYAWRTKLKKGVLWSWDPPLIEKDRITLPQLLKNNGYATAAIGKWHLGWDWPTKDDRTAKEGNGENVDYSQPIRGGPLTYGFDYYFGDDVPNFPPYTFIENKEVVSVPSMVKPDSLFGTPGQMTKGWALENVMPEITQKAVEYIKNQENREDPFFMYFALTAPHTPIAPAPEFQGTSNAGAYGDFVQEVDWAVGEIMKILEKTGKAENTIFVFTSDNGSPARNGEDYSGPTESVIAEFGHRANGDWRGLKGDAWEAGHRVPFIVRWPGYIKKDSKNAGLISSLDILATVQDLLGCKKDVNISPDGQSFLMNLENGGEVARESLVHHSHQGVFAIRKGHWKLILSDRSGGFSDGKNPTGYGIDTPGQLYNLSEDPGESKNLYDNFPEKVEELTELLETIQMEDN
ncbi:sulfatase family protein [Membranihabitans maritimus]|uniref:sulfatase family protein n=1 Tax=Membranihabitans maritimus TaxID=2904244 RepID=UPI001F46C895|nr:arylsulfatase [Membranihabitans maritimus]